MFIKYELVILLVLGCAFIIYGLPCNKRKYADGIVCVCNETFCDTLDNVDLTNKNSYVLISSSRDGLRFYVTKGRIDQSKSQIIIGKNLKNLLLSEQKGLSDKRLFGENIIKASLSVNRKKLYQEIIGFGGAFTGTVSHLLNKTTPSIQHHIYKSFYSNTLGIGYNFMRIPIGASDFDIEPWAYNVHPINDLTLSNFTALDKRDLQRIDQIDDLRNVTNNSVIKFVAAAWSCPPWMKTNAEWSGRDFLKLEFYQTWADYHVRFLQLMAEKNVNFWAISTGNEPFNSVIAWLFILFLDLGWTANQQGKWVGENIGPTLRDSNFSNVKLLGLDDQRYQLAWWFQDMNLVFPNSTQFIDGIAVHWYRDKMVPTTFLDFIHTEYPEKFILNTESSIVGTPKLGSWKRAERYILGFIEDLNHHVAGWIDWNLMVDLVGGPNYARNFVDAPIIMNTTGNEIYKQPIFYAIGHFSRFCVENSIRIDATSSALDDVLVIACKRADGSIAVIIYNKSENVAEIILTDDENKIFSILIPAKSIHTLIYF